MGNADFFLIFFCGNVCANVLNIYLCRRDIEIILLYKCSKFIVSVFKKNEVSRLRFFAFMDYSCFSRLMMSSSFVKEVILKRSSKRCPITQAILSPLSNNRHSCFWRVLNFWLVKKSLSFFLLRFIPMGQK